VPGLRQGESWRSASGACSVGSAMRQEARSCSLVERVTAGQTVFSGHGWCLRQRWEPVQQESTATHTDRGGRAGTRRDGDLPGWTRVDVLPPDGMQEVRSSNLLSSTQVRSKIRTDRTTGYSSKVPQRRPGGPPYVCSDRYCTIRAGCWQGRGYQSLLRCLQGVPPGQFLVPRDL